MAAAVALAHAGGRPRRASRAALGAVPSAAAEQRPLRPTITHTREGRVPIGDGATMYFREYGNREGVPAVVLHGGPGAGCYANHARFFDPEAYRIILADQRGCGASRPRVNEANISGNTLCQLVKDFEVLRSHLNVERWMLFGGSFGTTLSLAYAAAHPHRVSGIVLRGVCLLRREELDWLYRDGVRGGGAGALFPQSWDAFVGALPPELRYDPVQGYRELLSGARGASARDAAAGAWLTWGMAVGNGLPGEEAGIVTFELDQKGAASVAGAASNADSNGNGEVSGFVAQAILENWYVARGGFVADSPLLSRVVDAHSSLRDIPGIVVHGRGDFVCPVRNAYDLAHAWPEPSVRVVCGGKHSMYHRPVQSALLDATDELAGLL